MGAITECSACGVASSGHFDLDVTFSDHRMSWENLEHFGGIIRTIAEAGVEDRVRHWAFLLHVSERYPELLTVDPPAEQRDRAAAVLEGLSLPTVDLQLKTPRGTRVVGSDSWTGLIALTLVGSLVVAAGLSIETHELPWYQDVRAILIVGLGAIMIAGALQSGWKMRARS